MDSYVFDDKSKKNHIWFSLSFEEFFPSNTVLTKYIGNCFFSLLLHCQNFIILNFSNNNKNALNKNGILSIFF